MKKEYPVEHATWRSMRQRCGNPFSTSYKNYGGRGINVCERWAIFKNFIQDMGRRPEGMSLDRINNDLGYSPDNCRWATKYEQSINRRNVAKVMFEGELRSLYDLCKVHGFNINKARYNLKVGREWNSEDVNRKVVSFYVDGVRMTPKRAESLTGISRNTFLRRYNAGEENILYLGKMAYSNDTSKKLTNEKVKEIRSLLERGELLQNISALYKISESTVSKIKTGKAWKWVI